MIIITPSTPPIAVQGCEYQVRLDTTGADAYQCMTAQEYQAYKDNIASTTAETAREIYNNMWWILPGMIIGFFILFIILA